MRALALVFAVSCVVATSGAAHAKRPPRDVDLLDPFDKRAPTQPAPDPCTQGKTWDAIERCLGKAMVVETMYDADPVKIVRTTSRQAATLPRPTATTLRPMASGQLLMYTRREKLWVRSGFYAMSSSGREDIRISKFSTPVGDGVRIDTGSSMRSIFSSGPGVPGSVGLVQRISSMVCTPSTWSCRSVLTSCDVYTRGRLLWTFRGELYWHAAQGLRLRGDTTRAGGQCVPPKFMIDVEESGDEP